MTDDAKAQAIRELFPPRDKVAPCPWCDQVGVKRTPMGDLYHTPRNCCSPMNLLVASWLLGEVLTGRTKVQRWLDDARARQRDRADDPTTWRLKRHGCAYPWESSPDAVQVMPSLTAHLWWTTDQDTPCVYDEMRQHLGRVDDPEATARTVVRHLAGWPRLGRAELVSMAAAIGAERKDAALVLEPPTTFGPA